MFISLKSTDLTFGSRT